MSIMGSWCGTQDVCGSSCFTCLDVCMPTQGKRIANSTVPVIYMQFVLCSLYVTIYLMILLFLTHHFL
jgi:hypothetical protein